VSYGDLPVLRYTTDYFIRLLTERHAIRAALMDTGGSLILTGVAATTESTHRYSRRLGNPFHLDLLEAEAIVQRLPKDQQLALLQSVDGMTAKESAYFANVKPDAIRKRRQRARERAAQLWASRGISAEEN
jgi:DNA-directed RNA polymerase specialized sigma24 family protein